MSVETLALVLHHSQATGTDKLVLLGIANHDGDGGAWPSVATLARYANVQDRAIRKCVSRLVELGELRVSYQQGGPARMRDAQRPNRYDVLVRCPRSCDGTSRHRPRPPEDGGQLAMPVDNSGGPSGQGGPLGQGGEVQPDRGTGVRTDSQTVPSTNINHVAESVSQPQTARASTETRRALVDRVRAELARPLDVDVLRGAS